MPLYRGEARVANAWPCGSCVQVPYSLPAEPRPPPALWQPAAAHPPIPWSAPTGRARRGAGTTSDGWARHVTAQAATPAATVTRLTTARRFTGAPSAGRDGDDMPSLRPAPAGVNLRGGGNGEMGAKLFR